MPGRNPANHPFDLRIVLLGQQSYLAGECNQAIEQDLCLVLPTQRVKVIHQPERAREKQPLAGRQAVAVGVA